MSVHVDKDQWEMEYDRKLKARSKMPQVALNAICLEVKIMEQGTEQKRQAGTEVYTSNSAQSD